MERLISCLGLVVMVGIAWSLSSHRWKVNWRLVVSGILLQLAFAAVIILTPIGQHASSGVTVAFEYIEKSVEAGTVFMFGINERPTDVPSDETTNPDDDADDESTSTSSEVDVKKPTGDNTYLPPRISVVRTFAFGVLPTVVFFSSLMSVFYYLGVMQFIVSLLAKAMQWTLGVSGAEALSAAANVFVGHTEAPLVIKPYLDSMTKSELNAVMVGGFATISGGLLAAYAGMGINAGDLLTASIISAPAALVVAKVLQPETDQPVTMGVVKIDVPRRGVNVIEAAAIGATDGMKLAINVAAMLLAFLAMIAMLNFIIGGVGWMFGQVDADGKSLWSLSSALGYTFAPIAWLMGVEWKDCLHAGELLGLKTAANEFVAYHQFGEWLRPDSGVDLSPRTQRIMTYALSGFSNFGAIGIQIGGIGGLAPDRRPDLARLGFRAMIGGAIACCMTACIAGILK